MDCKNNNTITYDEKVTGWTSFHSFTPDSMVGMNSRFFSFQGGNLHMHHSEDATRNSYYGVVSPSKISMMVNEEPSTVKEIQAVSIEGNYAWETKLNAFIKSQDNPTMSSITEEEYTNKEGFWYAYARRNEDAQHLDSRSTYGIGATNGVPTSNVISYIGYSSSLTIGDTLYRGDTLEPLGIIQSYTLVDITLDTNIPTDLPPNTFILGSKNARVEGGNLRGYTLRIDLEISKEDKVELYAVNSEVIKSYS